MKEQYIWYPALSLRSTLSRPETRQDPPYLVRARALRATMVVSVIAKYMQGYKQFGWKAALTKMYTVSIFKSFTRLGGVQVGGRIANAGLFRAVHAGEPSVDRGRVVYLKVFVLWYRRRCACRPLTPGCRRNAVVDSFLSPKGPVCFVFGRVRVCNLPA